MDLFGSIQLAVFVLLLFLLTKPMGLYLYRVLDAEGRTFLDPAFKPVECLLYRLFRINRNKEQDWQAYTISILVFSLTGLLFTYGILRLQHLLPLNPQGFGPVGPDLAFNTAVSFTTNTNWQNYAGESTLSYFSQMAGLAFHNFVSAAVGIAAAAALVRGIARHAAKTVGNFWVDLVRINLYLLLPLCFSFSVFLVSQGVIQNFKPYVIVTPLETRTSLIYKGAEVKNKMNSQRDNPAVEIQDMKTQIIPQGPVASQVAIKMLGTNGGGFFNANAAHPYENPSPLSNFMQMLSIFLIPGGLTYYLGRMVNEQRHGWAIWGAMAIIFLSALLICWWAESSGNPRLQTLGLSREMGNMEGKEVRFGVFNSALFAVITTGASCGAVNSMHDSFSPLGGLVALFNIQTGGVIFGGVGAGLYGILVFTVIAIFLAGLMIGRTPEYLGKKIEAYDVKVSVLAMLISIFCILGFSAAALVGKWGLGALGNTGPHGLSEILYAYSSASGNNGSAFAGLAGNSLLYNTTLGLAMLFGRFFVIVPVMALAGNMAKKRPVPLTGGAFPVRGITFMLILTGEILIVGALTFLPALAMGPLVEHFLMTGSAVLY